MIIVLKLYALADFNTDIARFEQCSKEDLHEVITSILSDLQNNELAAEQMLSSGIEFKIAAYLKDIDYRSSHGQLAQLIAECCKHDEWRNRIAKVQVVPSLIGLVESDDEKNCYQSLRALGNLCYESPTGRQCIASNGATEKLISIVSSSTAKPNINMLQVSLGCLLNYINDCDENQTLVLSAGIISTLLDCIRSINDSKVISGALSLLTIIGIKGIKEMIAHNAGNLLLFLLCDCQYHAIQESVIETIMEFIEDDDFQRQISEDERINNMISKIEQIVNDDDTDEETIDNVVAIIVHLLGGNYSMKIMFNNGTGKIVPILLGWLRDKRVNLKAAACLGIGNIARSDSNCEKLADFEIIPNLLEAVKPIENTDRNSKLAIAALSAIKNLSICSSVRPKLINEGSINSISSLLSSLFSPTIYKSLSILRLLATGNDTVANQLGSSTEILTRIVELCNVLEHEGVSSEALRLLACIIKETQNKNIITNIAAIGGIDHIISMLHNQHTQLQNEGAVALLITSAVADECLHQSLHEAGIVKEVVKVVQDSNVIAEVRCNLLSLIEMLWKVEPHHSNLKLAGVEEAIHCLRENDSELVKAKAKDVVNNCSLGDA
ncbi:Rap1 GTPase-GDP dissociation stimulator 1-B [Trichoplax sp. H2]|nr:Rap1 GTPase-GDP dissociation stimulator 1-B [Trichoplax sp. H2]|eukprot:RDD39043.1 Rap1 GTPase-GDP dissociation stimulator 1-B [Trichoplax sp. H2]